MHGLGVGLRGFVEFTALGLLGFGISGLGFSDSVPQLTDPQNDYHQLRALASRSRLYK